MTDKKRDRGSNWTKEDELILLDEIEKYKKIIENKKTDTVTGAQKNEIWKKILNGINAKTGSGKTISQIKSKYDNLKTKARKWVAERKYDFKGTGGGPAITSSADPIIEAVLRLLNFKTVAGLPSQYDEDFEDNSEVDNDEIIEINICDPDDPGDLQNTDWSSYSEDVLKAPVNNILCDVEEAAAVIPNTNCSTYSGKMLKTPLNKPLKRTTIIDPEQAAAVIPNTNWSTYSGKMLKTPVSKRLKPTTVNPIFVEKQNYYKARAEKIQEEIRIMKAKEAREQEEHDKKMKLLNAQIRIAEKEANKE